MKTNFTEQDLQFYPTPKSLLDRITDSLKWDKFTFGVGTKCRKR